MQLQIPSIQEKGEEVIGEGSVHGILHSQQHSAPIRTV